MKKSILWLLPILFIALLSFSGCEDEMETGSEDNPVDEQENGIDPDYDTEKVLVRVNGDEITQGDFDTYILQLKHQYEEQQGLDLDDPQHGDIAEELKIRAMNDLIEQRALVQRSEELDLTVPSSFVDQQIQGIIQQQGSEEEFESFLENRELTREDLEVLIEEDQLITAVYEQELDLNNISYDEEELDALYDRFVKQREDMGREPESFEEVEDELAQSLIQRRRQEVQRNYVENLIDNSDIEYFFN
ncbi:SurA N-terminal domain-containing protein [Isachenkonia alkalipeptolytica]|uniref:Peptidylprolyl isomerase n=1 Tax=Isachenkonia alkalipeptolytica TaxID=2565777 RepID=A0AA43XKG4_9CLOT|nr:SurA N-terminal domain-containing protein [Isachenkonia alkalipeptolytica]NBG87966.1 hypothetical protein [Isachenkonia alkalipeptolytica]